MKTRTPLTATDFYRYLQCPHWPYWERFGNPKERRPWTELEEQCQADGLEHEKQIVKKYFGEMHEVRVLSAEQGFEKTLKLMQEGVPIIYQGWLKDADWVGRPDLLERREGKSIFGNWYYAPLDIKRAHEMKKEYMAQLTFYALLLERIQKRFPGETAIINADGERLPFAPDGFIKEFEGMREAIERIRDGEIPEPVYRKSCVDTSPWSDACFRLAAEQNDIALLFNVDVRKLKSLRSLGIKTVDDAAELNPESLEGQALGLTLRGLSAIKRQARSLRDQCVIIRDPFEDKTKGLEIHFDIESHPPTDTDYLYGFWIKDTSPHYVAFVAETPEEEEKMWKGFLAWLPTLPPEYTIYHYANYEVGRLKILAKRYGDGENTWLARFASRMIDLKEGAREHAVFPLYFYSLKQICKFLGFSWTGDVQGGRESVVAFEKWLETKKRSVLESILQYNEEDVKATAFLLEWLKTYAKERKEYGKPYPWDLSP
ncbi:TM0106 family RecB-like putative nuclease [Candidatus Uhrbacteria bacterium]|nr:TM0106 family RecB-like putative nuclease [Candidatus Uhrbacteria bacterium]